MRLTPAGIPVVEAVISHLSQQREAGLDRKAECEIPLVAIGDQAKQMANLHKGDTIRIKGFLAAAGIRRRRDLVLHLQEFELLN